MGKPWTTLLDGTLTKKKQRTVSRHSNRSSFIDTDIGKVKQSNVNKSIVARRKLYNIEETKG